MRTCLFLLIFCTAAAAARAQAPSFLDTLNMVARPWKLAAVEGVRDTSVHIEQQKNATLVFNSDQTYYSKQGDSTTGSGIWAIDREKKWLLCTGSDNRVTISRIEKLDARQWILSIDVNDDKIILTMVPLEHK